MSLRVTLISIHDPRSGMMRQACNARSPSADSLTKSTPGLRCNCDTITRSDPFTINSPPPIMIGISPRKIASSVTSSTSFRRSRTVTRNGMPYVRPSSRHSSDV